MNLLADALVRIRGVLKSEEIVIQNKKLINYNGFAKEEVSECHAEAHIQPLNPAEVSKITSGTLDSLSCYRFYLIGDLASVLNSLNNTDCLIKWGDRAFRVYSKEDWSSNGWIMVIGTETSSEVKLEAEDDVQ